MRYILFVDDVCHGIERERGRKRERGAKTSAWSATNITLFL